MFISLTSTPKSTPSSKKAVPATIIKIPKNKKI